VATEDIHNTLPFLENVGLLLTYKCQVSCPHCILEAGPRRTEEMRMEDAAEWIRQVSRYRDGHVKVLSITGGEPFFNITKFQAICDLAANNGLLVTVVSNAYWASTPEAALKLLRELPSLAMLGISTDVYHQETIPLDRVFNAISAAKACSIPYKISVCTESRNDSGYKSTMAKLQEIVDPVDINTVETVLAGRALVTLGRCDHPMVAEPPSCGCLPAASPIIFPDGRVIACIGALISLSNPHPLVLGNLHELSLEEIFDRAEVNALVHAIRVWGPRKLWDVLRAAGYDAEVPHDFIANNLCDACYRLFSRPTLVSYLANVNHDPDFTRKTAYARMFYLKEAQMLERLRDQLPVED